MKPSLSRYALAVFASAAFLFPSLSAVASPVPAGNVQSVPPQDAPCCGALTPNAQKILAVLDHADVEHLWLNHHHVNWETGKPDRPDTYSGPGNHTHCSAFAAAVGAHLGVYMLRPPQHSQIFLASAQTRWFDSSEGRQSGWIRVSDAWHAQQLANKGMLVVVAYESPDQHRPGHIAVVRPSRISLARLRADGPDITQAGSRNMTIGHAADAFSGHRGAWPDGVKFFAHALPQ